MVALAGVARLVGASSLNQKVAGSIPRQSTNQSGGSIPFLVHTIPRSMFLPRSDVSLALPSSLSKSNEKMSSGEDKSFK